MKKPLPRQLFIGLFILGLLLATALLSYLWTPYDPLLMISDKRLLPPSWGHPLGTDLFGRDLLSRMMKGTVSTLSVVFIALSLGFLVGISTGIILQMGHSFWRRIMGIILHLILIFPPILFALLIISVAGAGLRNTALVLGFLLIPRFAWITQASIMQAQEKSFVLMSITMGQTTLKILWNHILPTIRPLLITTTSLTAATIILTEAGLSFLGMGVLPPDTSWGYSLYEAKNLLLVHPHLSLAPSLFITLAVLSFRLIGQGIAEQYSLKMNK
jgi:peptide/nickel transport system permease protein